MATENKIYLVIHNVRSAYNVGSIFRTADGAGASKIYLCGYSPIPERNANLQIHANPSERMFIRADAANRKPTKANHSSLHSSNKIAKTSLGAENMVEWEYQRQTWRLLKELRANGVWLIALELGAKSKNLFTYKPPKNKPLAILVGHERRGLSSTILKYVDDIVEIPMHGKKESLNVSVAVGIALYWFLW